MMKKRKFRRQFTACEDPGNAEDARESVDNVEAEEEGAEVAELGEREERDLHREEDKAEEGDS